MIERYDPFRVMTTFVKDLKKIDEEIESGLNNEGPDYEYTVAQGPIIWTAPDGSVGLTFVYQHNRHRSGPPQVH